MGRFFVFPELEIGVIVMEQQGLERLSICFQPVYALLDDRDGERKAQVWNVSKLSGAGDLRAQVRRLDSTQQPTVVLGTVATVLLNLHRAAKGPEGRCPVYDAVLALMSYAKGAHNAEPIAEPEFEALKEQDVQDLGPDFLSSEAPKKPARRKSRRLAA